MIIFFVLDKIEQRPGEVTQREVVPGDAFILSQMGMPISLAAKTEQSLNLNY